MSDSNEADVNDKLNLADKSRMAIQFLKNIAVENEIQLNLLKREQKESADLLLVKQQEQTMLQKSNSNNYELFSPNYVNENNLNLIADEITEITKKQEEISKAIKVINEKGAQLTNIFDCMEYIEEIAGQNKDEASSFITGVADNGIGLLETQEKERQRIARDLHDSTVQNLTGLVHKTELCLKLMDIDPIRAKLELATMSNTIKAVINDMRDIIYNLKPMSLDDLGLVVTVERYARQIMEAQDLQVVVQHNTEKKGILPVINLTLFRIIQEACCNIRKHANASLIEINIDYHENDITVSIKDNGTGFDLEMQKMKSSGKASGFGLSIMKERTSLLSGTLKIHSENGKGTIITVLVPITKCEGEKNE